MSPTVDRSRVVGYVRVSTDEQAESGAGLAAQRQAILQECERRGWELIDLVSDEAVSGGVPFAERPGGRRVLELLASREAGGLVVAKMDRLTRGIKDFVGLHDQAQAERWALVMLDVDLDTSTPTGEFTANIRASAAQFERRLIGQRTREALAQKRAQGIRLGRPPEIDTATEELIVSWRREGLPLRTIVDQLNSGAVATARSGASWHVSTIRRVLGRHETPSFRPGRRRS